MNKVNYSENGLFEIPDEVLEHNYIEQLDFSKNKLSEIPEKLYELTNLKILNLASNNLTKINKGISKLKNLEYLYLGGNKLKEIPEEIFELTNLKFLGLLGNNYTFLSPKVLNLKNLNQIRLNDKITNVPNNVLKAVKSQNEQPEPIFNYFKEKERQKEEIKPIIKDMIDEYLSENENLSSFNEQKENLKELYRKAEEDSKKHNEKAETIYKTMQNTAKNIGVGKHETIFEEQANEHKSKSDRWLFWGLIFAIGLCYLAYHFLDHFSHENIYNSAQVFYYLSIRAFILSVCFYILLLFSRNYRAHKHNYIVNKHKRNCLKTFKTFYEAEKNPEIKNIILLQAAQTIFSAQPSGHIKENEAESSNNIIRFINEAYGAGTKRD